MRDVSDDGTKNNVDHIHRRDLYSAPRPSRRNEVTMSTDDARSASAY